MATSGDASNSGWRAKLFYLIPTAIYAAWVIWLNTFPHDPDFRAASFMGRIVAILLSLVGYGTRQGFGGLSASIELKLLFGPGFFAGLIVGYSRVRSLKESLKGLIPPALFLLPFIPFMILPQGIWLIISALPLVFVTAIPYAWLGAVVGWQLALARKPHSSMGAKVLLLTILFSVSSGTVLAYGPTIGHRNIVARGNTILKRDSPDQFKEVDRYLTTIQDGAEQEDGTLLNGYFGENGPKHFHNPLTTRAGQGLFTNGLSSPQQDAIDRAIGEWLDADTAYKNGDKAGAWKLVGQVAHLVTGDMYQPEHTHDDPHAPHFIGGDSQVIEDKFDLNPAVVSDVGLPLSSPISGPLNSNGVLQFGNTASRFTYLGSRFTGSLPTLSGTPAGTETGTITMLDGASLGVHLVLADPLSTNADLRVNHWETVEANPQFYDYGVTK